MPEATSTGGGVSFSVTSDGGYDDITATIPASAASSGGKRLVGRLKATE